MSTLDTDDFVALHDLIYKIVRNATIEIQENIEDQAEKILERKYDADVLKQTFEDFLYDLKMKMEKWDRSTNELKS